MSSSGGVEANQGGGLNQGPWLPHFKLGLPFSLISNSRNSKWTSLRIKIISWKVLAIPVGLFLFVFSIYQCWWTKILKMQDWGAAIDGYTLCLKKTSPFYFCDIFVRFHPILLIFGRNIRQEIWNKHIHGPIYISSYMFILYFVKTSDAWQRTLQRRPVLVRLVIKPESCKLFKRLFKPLTFQPSSENSWTNFQAPKTLNLYKFFIKMRLWRRLIVAWSGLVCISVSWARQSTMWRRRLRACVWTDGRDFKHLFG